MMPFYEDFLGAAITDNATETGNHSAELGAHTDWPDHPFTTNEVPVSLTLRATALTLALASVAGAQRTTTTGPGMGGSAHVKSEWTIDGASIAISYGRPSIKGRADAQLMPPDRPWRTGADTATTLVTNKPLKFGGVTLAPGSYTINTQPGATAWQFIVGKLSSPGQWGVPYKADLEIGRVPMTLATNTASVEQVTISIDDTAAGATLRIEWGMNKASVPFTVEK